MCGRDAPRRVWLDGRKLQLARRPVGAGLQAPGTAIGEGPGGVRRSGGGARAGRGQNITPGTLVRISAIEKM